MSTPHACRGHRDERCSGARTPERLARIHVSVLPSRGHKQDSELGVGDPEELLVDLRMRVEVWGGQGILSDGREEEEEQEASRADHVTARMRAPRPLAPDVTTAGVWN
ncbi:hypothetical protein EYF80_030002 [Liparis tanakae]|uniref:Uncharacterized protein n=1 Tax=Liparis tanakae TaxID=230148 RepID=A0A4Z2H1Q6_9TELE|nr:hypothetical protein EYF80_030002 [Liparis tanakae]